MLLRDSKILIDALRSLIRALMLALQSNSYIIFLSMNYFMNSVSF